MMGASLFLVVGPVNIGELAQHSRRSRPQRRDLRRTDRAHRRTTAQGPDRRRHPRLADPGPHQRRAARKSEIDPTTGEPRVDRGGAGRVPEGGRHMGPLPEGRQGTEPLGRPAHVRHQLPPRPELADLRGSDRIPRRGGGRSALRGAGPAQRRRLDDPRRLRSTSPATKPPAPRRARRRRRWRARSRRRNRSRNSWSLSKNSRKKSRKPKRKPKKPKKAKAKNRSKTRWAVSAGAPAPQSLPSRARREA